MSGQEGVGDASASRPDLYLWNKKKRRKRVHIAGTNRKTLCQIENSRTRLNGRGSQISAERRLCQNCKSLWAAGVRIARPHRLQNRDHNHALPSSWGGLSSSMTTMKTGFNPVSMPEKTEFNAAPVSEKTEARLSVLLGKAVDDSPPWNESPGDDGWRGPRPC